MKAQVRLPILFVVLLSSISVFAVDVKTDYDHKANFTQYKTYSWAKVETANPLWDERVKDAVDKALSAKDGRRYRVEVTFPLLQSARRTINRLWRLFITVSTAGDGVDSGTPLPPPPLNTTKRARW
jgi:hypothetical protein